MRPDGEICLSPTFCAEAKSAAAKGSAAEMPRWARIGSSISVTITSGFVAWTMMSTLTGAMAVAVISREVASTKNRMPANKPTAKASPNRYVAVRRGFRVINFHAYRIAMMFFSLIGFHLWNCPLAYGVVWNFHELPIFELQDTICMERDLGIMRDHDQRQVFGTL